MKVFFPFHRYFIVFSTLFLLFSHHITAQTPIPKHEVRAVWLTTIGGLDWPHTYAQTESSALRQKRELCDILDKLKAANVNTVLLQTRIRGTVIYPSLYEPWDGCLSGVPGRSPGYDALAFAIDECHKRGMEIHAWVVTMPVGKWTKSGCQHLRKRYPKMLRMIGEDGYMNPECDETAVYLGKICREIAENYDVDGIHLDYIRYPETWPLKVTRPQGRQFITSIVRHIHNEVKAAKPWVKMSCSPIGKYNNLTRYDSYGWNAYNKGCQDAQGWLRDGLMDELFPMMYFRGDQFYPFVLDWQENSYGRTIAVGLGIYFLSEKEKNWSADIIKRQMEVVRRQGLGHAYFRSRFFTDNVKGIYDYAKDMLDNHPALVPAMTWASATPPLPPVTFNVRHGTDSDNLSWCDATDRSGGPYLLYNVYASPTWPVDISDARNLVTTNYRRQEIRIGRKSSSRPLHYAVTAMDRYGNESEPVCSPAPKNEYIATTIMRNDGRRLRLPERGNNLDADYLTIESMQGNIIKTLPYRETSADISDVPEGVYILKSLGKKGVTHRLYHFTIKRKQSRR